MIHHGVDHERGLTTEHENWRHPEDPRFFQRHEGSLSKSTSKGDPSLRLKNGYAQDDPQPAKHLLISRETPKHGEKNRGILIVDHSIEDGTSTGVLIQLSKFNNQLWLSSVPQCLRGKFSECPTAK